MKIVVILEDINPALKKHEGLDNETLGVAFKDEISQLVNARRNDLTHRLKARDVVPQLAFDYFVEIEVK